MSNKNKIDTSTGINMSYYKKVSSKSKVIQQELLENLWLKNTSELLLLLSVIASYYVNSEIIKKDANKFFVKTLEDLSLGRRNEHTDYIKNHINTYKMVFSKYKEILNDNWMLENWSIWNILEILRNDLFGYKRYRKWLIVHWEWARLKRKIKYISYGRKAYESNFVFPPDDYIEKLISSLDKKLKEPNISVYKRAAYIGTYIFMTHPFEDGNSRSSRIAMISYLDFLSKKDFKFFTFITNFSSNLSSSSYNEFLKENIYSEYNKFRSKIKISDEWEILEYIPIEEYENIIEKVVDKLTKRIISSYKEIIYNKHNILLFAKIISLYKEKYINDSKYSGLFRKFLLDVFSNINKNWLENLSNFIKEYKFNKKFKKKHEYKYEENDYEKLYNEINSLRKDILEDLLK